ncbi:hypothetical protein, partial [Kitasatospora putterlickiae]|uniref:hypothetical protein n=1 Tax=Kitasatospora putterlickiae TaxID=221725 RepID=UPI0031D48FEC
MYRRFRPARLLVMPLLASALALAAPLPAVAATPAVPAAEPGFLPETVVSGRPLPQPRVEKLLAAGPKGFLHGVRDNKMAWTSYETGTTSTVDGAYFYEDWARTPAQFGATGDYTVAADPNSGGTSWKLQNMADGTSVTLTTPVTTWLGGVYGDAVLVETHEQTSPTDPSQRVAPLTFLRADAAGGTVSIPVTGFPDQVVPARIRLLGGDAKEAMFGFKDAAGTYRIALADTGTGALRISPPVTSADKTEFWCPGLEAISPDRVAWMGADCNVHVLSRADLSAAETVVPFGPANQPQAIGLTGDWLLSVNGPASHGSPTPDQAPLMARPIAGGTPVALLPHAAPILVPTPEGGVLAEGGDTSSSWQAQRITTTGSNLPTVVTTGYRVEPNAYTLQRLSLSANVLTSAENESFVGAEFQERRFTPGAAPAITAPVSLGAEQSLDPTLNCGASMCDDLTGTGDGRTVHVGRTGLVVHQGRDARLVFLYPGAAAHRVAEASGGLVLLDQSTPQNRSMSVIGIDAPRAGQVMATVNSVTATLDEGTLYSPGSAGEITALDLDTQQTRTLKTGKACTITSLLSSRGWLYWSCGQSAGLLRPATGSAIEVPPLASAIGDGFLFYAYRGEFGTVVDFHTGTPVTSTVRAMPAYGDKWSVDRFGSGLVFSDRLQNLHFVSVTAPAQGTTYTPVSPDRLLDTRSAVGRPSTDKVPGRTTVP